MEHLIFFRLEHSVLQEEHDAFLVAHCTAEKRASQRASQSLLKCKKKGYRFFCCVDNHLLVQDLHSMSPEEFFFVFFVYILSFSRQFF